jgi:hypothetical protein
VRGGRVFGIISHHSRSPSVRANSRANSSRLQTEQKQTKHKPLFPFQAAPPQRFTAALRRFGVCVFITAGPITKLFAGGGGGEWRTCAMRNDEPRPVWMSPLITH